MQLVRRACLRCCARLCQQASLQRGARRVNLAAMWHGADLTRSLTQEQKDHAAELAQQDSLPWRGLNDICTFLR